MNPGLLFGEHIKTEKIRLRRYREEEGIPSSSSMRGVVFLIFLAVATVLVFGKLFFLQIIHGAEYQNFSDANRIRTKVIHAPRGVIFDRNGKPLVYNIPGFLDTKKEKTRHLTKDEALKRIADGDLTVAIDSFREYPYKDAASHIIGYLGQISEEELQMEGFADYSVHDWIGKNGIERMYEPILKGIDGKELVEVDAMGKQIRSLGQTDPISGDDLTLTVDIDLQQKVYTAAKEIKKGVIILTTPDGQILSLVSKPSFDANLFTLDNTYKPASDSAYKSVSAMLTDEENKPLLNRVIGGVYPPGSTFKILTAISGLEDKVIDEAYHVTDTGILKVGAFSYANWYYTGYGKTDGEVNVVKALSRSNDIFFYKLAEKVGVARLAQTAKQFGVGAISGIDLGGEVAGVLPTKEWKKKTLQEDWYLGDTYHYGIGQGYLLTTPLQVNSWTEVVANGGTLYQPRLLKNGGEKVKEKGLLSKQTQELVREGMIASCREGGVAYPLFEFRVPAKGWSASGGKNKIDGRNFVEVVASGGAKMVEIPVACKTGTAQHGGEQTLPHAWITLFAPAYDPEIVVTVLEESAGEGSKIAAPVAKKVLEAYFTK